MNPKSWDKEVFRKRLFQLLVFFTPTQLAFHLWPNWALVFGLRVDYLSVAIYMTDVFILLYLFLFLSQKPRVSKKIILILLLLLMLAAINSLVAENPMAALFRWLKFFELAVLAWAVSREKSLSLKSWFAWPFTASLALFSLVGILQFGLGRTLGGPLYFLGERNFSVSTPGISLINFFGEERLRAYSTFSHPNSFGAYLLVSSLLTYPFLDISRKKKAALLVAPFFAFFLTFSKGVLMAAVILFVVFVVFKKGVLQKKLYIPKAVLFLTILLSLLLPVLTKGLSVKTLPETFAERLVLAEVAFKGVSSSPAFGLGAGNFFAHLAKNTQPSGVWLIQPVHNIFLFLLVETGFVGLVALALLFWVSFERLSKILNNKISLALTLALSAVVLTGFSDHYWVTLQQNQILLSFVLGLSFRKRFS